MYNDFSLLDLVFTIFFLQQLEITVFYVSLFFCHKELINVYIHDLNCN